MEQLATAKEAAEQHVISFRVEPHRLSDRIRGKLLFLLAWPTLVINMRRRSRRSELWIGDSNAMSVNREVSNSNFMRAPEGQLVLRTGARLMFSLARKGFHPRVMRVARFVNRFGRPGALVPIFVAGEIDVRAHLPKRPDAPLDFVEDYIERCMEVARLLKADRVGILVTQPPVDIPEQSWFPVAGTIEERVAAHRRLREAIISAVAKVPEAILIDLTDVLADDTGKMPIELTMDGAHSNPEGIARIRKRVAEYRLLAD
jgi:hypothetical protein